MMKTIILALVGFLLFSTPVFPGQGENVLIILDCSLSMEEKIQEQPKIDIAKQVINRVLSEIPPNVNVGLRVYGHKRNFLKNMFLLDECEVSELLVPVGTNNRQKIHQALSGLKPVGMTPICYSLELATDYDFVDLPGKKRIILVSDGMETCSGNPCELAVELVKRNKNVSIDVIGFDVSSDPSVTSNLRCVALATRGNFYAADTPEEFLRSMRRSFSVSTEVQGRILGN